MARRIRRLTTLTAAAALTCCLVLAAGAPATDWHRAVQLHGLWGPEAGSFSAAPPVVPDGRQQQRRRLVQQGAGEQPLGIVVGGQAQLEQIPGTNRSFIMTPQGIIPGPVTKPGSTNLHQTLHSCADNCAAFEKCTVFNWCPANRTVPCNVEIAGGAPLPPGACELRNQATVSEGNSIILLAEGPGVETIGGVPNTTLPGYASFPGMVMLAQYRLHCPGSLRNDSCRLHGTPEELGAACVALPDCQAVEYSFSGRDGVNGSLGTLKGNIGNLSAPLDLRKATWNPRAVLLVREGVPVIPPATPLDQNSTTPVVVVVNAAGQAGGDGGGLSASAVAGIAVGATAAAAAVLAAVVVYIRRRRRLKRQQTGAAGKLLPALQLFPSSSDENGSTDVEMAAGAPVVVHSPTAGSLSTPRRRASSAPQAASEGATLPSLENAEQQLLKQYWQTSEASNNGSSSGSASGSAAPSAAVVEGGQEAAAASAPGSALIPGLAPWAAQLLSSSAAGWEEVVVKESEIQYVRGPDGEPISLGAGAFGTVWRVVLGGHAHCAAKVVEFSGRQHQQLEFLQEAITLRNLRHPNIVLFQGVTINEKRGILLMEYCAGKDLDNQMNARSRLNGARLFDWYNCGRKVAQDIASGMAYLHHCRVIHMDLKPHNVLLGRDGTAKLGDVGFARLMSRTHLSVDGRVGTFDWVAPEVLLGRGANEKSDIFSFGIILWEMCSGVRPRRGQLNPLRVPEQCPAEVAALQQACVSENPADRPTSAQLLQFFSDLPPSRRPSGQLPAAAPLPAPSLPGPTAGQPASGQPLLLSPTPPPPQLAALPPRPPGPRKQPDSAALNASGADVLQQQEQQQQQAEQAEQAGALDATHGSQHPVRPQLAAAGSLSSPFAAAASIQLDSDAPSEAGPSQEGEASSTS